MNRTWSRGRLGFLAIGVICVVVGLVLIVPSLIG